MTGRRRARGGPGGGPSLGGGPSSKRREYDVDVIVGHIRDGVAEVLDEAGIAPERLLGVGIGVPGIVARTPEEGAVVHGQTIGWDAVPLESLLRSACQLPDTVPYFADNGARTLGQAEMWFGAGRGARNAVVVLFGSGVGACLVTEDVEHGRSVEWGHLTVRVRGAAAGAAPWAAWRRTRARRPSSTAGARRADARPRAPTRRPRSPRCSPRPTRPRRASSPTPSRSPSWRRPPSTWARACPT